MTNDDKALVEQLRDEDSYYRIQEKHWCIDHVELALQRQQAADRIEALEAENERLRDALKGVLAHRYGEWCDIARAALKGVEG